MKCIRHFFRTGSYNQLFSGPILSFIGGKESAEIAIGKDYLQLRFYAMSFGIVNFVLAGFFRGIGDTRTPMVLALINSSLIILFTYTLAYGKWGFPELQLEGAGWAFLIGECVAFIGGWTHQKVNFNKSEAKLIEKKSSKLGIQEFSISVSMLIFTFFCILETRY
ncbi:MATE family efflux transporter [Chengkuizengella axinellae]|uniref:Probable multidrug resistance protein NorM n=1 Tax=Chengkuizengella axinellae TaxID=3064388 RepID=A0ABT9J0K6_9BACL|nr:MATE family efflux transporter [Chengkuizengella sp. 2205SS18-9]MDP5275140.1 MATE family efflux transporter [Chengkuizengella sp. 2205SS18-9]